MMALRRTKEPRNIQLGLRVSEKMKTDIDISADIAMLSTNEWLCRAVQEKLDRESGAVKDTATMPTDQLREMIREEIIKMGKKMKAEIEKQE